MLLTELGYDVVRDEPEFGSVIGFDIDARGHFLTTDADLPDEFVEPISTWIAGKDKVERCVAVTCAKCGRKVFTKRERLSANIFCRTCRIEPSGRQAVREVAEWLAALFFLPVFLAILAIPYMMGLRAAWITYVWLVIVVIGGIALNKALR